MSITTPVTSPDAVLARLTQAGVAVLGNRHVWAFDSGEMAHDFGKFLLIKGGSATLSGDVTADLVPGDLVLLDAGQVHRLVDRDPLELFMFFCDPERIPLWRTLMDTYGPAHHAQLGMETIRPLRRRLCELSRECLATDAWAHPQQRALATGLLATIDRTLTDARQRQTWPTEIRDVVAHIDQHLASPLTVAGLAAHCRLPYRTFTDRFRRHVGTTCGRYLAQRRIAWAQDLLRQGHDIAWVADEIGCGDLSQFYRLFKQHTGTSPGRWRELQG